MLRKLLSPILFVSLSLLGQEVAGPAGSQPLSPEAFRRLERPVQASPASPVADRLDPDLLLVVDALRRTGGAFRVASAAGPGSLPAGLEGLLDLRSEGGRDVIGVLVRADDPQAAAAAIRNVGGKVQVVSGAILGAEVPVESLEVLAASGGIRSVGASVRVSLNLDLSRPEIGADKVQAGTGLPTGYTGKGVIVGVIDSGVDFAHESFQGTSGTRVTYLWDQTLKGTPPAGQTIGIECTKAQMDARSCASTDTDGHGTHVASTAAGNGGSSGTYKGIAPEAEIVAVKTTLATKDVLLGIGYIFARADAAGKAAVVNMSLGTLGGPHDGTSSFEQAVAQSVKAGRLVAISQGNEAGTQYHVGYTASGTGPSTATANYWRVFPDQDGAGSSIVDLWCDGSTLSVGIAGFELNGNSVGVARGYTSAVAAGSGPVTGTFTGTDGKSYGDYSIVSARDAGNGLWRFRIAVDSSKTTYDFTKTIWGIYTFGSGRVDAWVTNPQPNSPWARFSTLVSGSGVPFRFVAGDNLMTANALATGSKVFSVGSYVTKNSWTDVDGVHRTATTTLGAISGFSSLGPTRDGRTKPEIAAPGERIAAALSSATSPDRTDTMPGGKYVLMQGTSMASPHVTGLLALMLQAKPALTYDEALAAVQQTARKDSQTGTTPNNAWGAGKVDALAAVKKIAGPAGFTLTVAKAGTGTGTVTSDTGGISCGSTCSATFTSGTKVTLSAAAGLGSAFKGWSGGGCAGTGSCSVTVTQAETVTATFDVWQGPTIRLAGGKIEVSVSYLNPYSGEGGPAIPIPQNDNFAYFYYTDSQNPEVFVKALDFGTEYKIFFGGLTDFQVAATFRNVSTGATSTLSKDAKTFNGGGGSMAK